ncbi:MAG: ABC transporter permease [Acidobacteria bacterium]|nr:ABC transporter permease [Acidobacteriota bacterium]
MTSRAQFGRSSNAAPTLASQMMMPRLLLRAIAHRPGKLIAVLSALVVSATLSSAFLSLYFDLPSKMTAEFRTLGPNLLIAPSAKSSDTESADAPHAMLPQATLAQARTLTPSAAMLPWLYAVGTVNQKSLVLAGTEMERIAQLHPSWDLQLAPAPFKPSGKPTDEPAVWMGERAAEQLAPKGWNAASNSEQMVKIAYAGRELELPLRGIVATGGSEDKQIFLPLDTLQKLTGHRGQLSVIEVAAPGETAQVEAARASLLAGLATSTSSTPGTAGLGTGGLGAGDIGFGDIEVRALRPVIEAQARVVMKIRGLMLGLTTMVLALVLLSVMTTVSGLVLDRSKEIGVMKALGGSDGRILQLLIAETSLLALGASIAGYAVGFGLARMAANRIFNIASGEAALALRGDVFAAVVGITVAVALLACALPAQQMKRIDPAVILRGE